MIKITAINCVIILRRINFCERLGVPPLAIFQMPMANITATTSMPTIDTKYNIVKSSLSSVTFDIEQANENSHAVTEKIFNYL